MEINDVERHAEKAPRLEFWEPSEEDIRELMAEHKRDLENRRLGTTVFDAGSRKTMTIAQFERFYGTDEFSKELCEAAERRVLYSKETAGKIKRLYKQKTQDGQIPEERSGRENIHAKKPKKRPSIKEQFLKIQYGFIEGVRDCRCHKNPTALLMTLMQHRSWDGKMDKHHTYTHWYKNEGKIVASRSVEQLARDMDVSEKTIRRWLNELEANGDIKKVKAPGDGYKRDNIYILGEIDADGNEILYHHRR